MAKTIKIKRHYVRKTFDDAKLKKLWPTRMRDIDLANLLGVHRSVMRRRAIKLGLPPRRELWRTL